MNNKKYIEQYALDDAVELAFEIDSYLRTNNPDYDRIYSKVRETQEDLADNIMVGKTDKIKQVFDDMGLTSSDEPLRRLYEYEEKYPHSVQNKKPFLVMIVSRQKQDNNVQYAKWLSLPVSPETFENALMEIGLPENSGRDSYFIGGYKTKYGSLDMYLSENENIDELNYLAGLLDNLSKKEKSVFKAAVNAELHTENAEDLINLAQNTGHYKLVPDIYDWEDYGKYLAKQIGIDVSSLYDIEDYIDFYKYGEDCGEMNNAVLLSNAVLEERETAFSIYYDGNTAEIPKAFRATPLVSDENFIEDKIKRSIELADSLDRFFSAHDMDYAAKYPDGVMAIKLSDSLANGETGYIKEMLADLGQGDNDVLPDELKEYEDKYTPDKYFIYQLKDTDAARNIRFEDLNGLHRTGGFADRSNYELVYSAALLPGNTLEKLYEKFNVNLPRSFKGHSLSVSDIIVLNKGGKETAYYCDSIGFKEVPEFLNYIGTRSAVYSNYAGYTALVGTDDKVYLGKSENYHFRFDAPSYYDNSDKSIIHISDDENMYSFLYGDGWVVSQQEMIDNGTFTQKQYKGFAELKNGVLSTLEVKREITFAGVPFNYLENAEKSEEQNYNQIDGQINNEQPHKAEKPSIRQQLKTAEKEQEHKLKSLQKTEPEL